MTEYIERGYLFGLLESEEERYGYLDVFDIRDAPAADVAPVIHAEWVDRQLTNNPAVIRYKCSRCGRHINTVYPRETEDFPYCHCGAKMDGNKLKTNT